MSSNPEDNQSYRLAKLLKHIENRLCADCSTALLEWQNYCALLNHRVWVCNSCYDIHVHLSEETRKCSKRIKDEWSDEEVSIMEAGGSNVGRNQVLERFKPDDWSKITSESTYLERNQWIKAKYLSRYFSIPAPAVVKQGSNSSKSLVASTCALPMRVVDYFVMLGPGKPKGKFKLECKEDVMDLHFTTQVLSTFPEPAFYNKNRSEVPDLLGPMVFPKGLTLSDKEEKPFAFTFVLTDVNRVKQYAAALIVYELMDPQQLKTMFQQRRASTRRDSLVGPDALQRQEEVINEVRVVYAPRALVILSHYPFYYLFLRFLEQIYHTSLSLSPLPIERYIANFMLEIPLPPQGRIEVSFSMPQAQMQISRPPRNELPMVDFSYRPLFAYMSIDNIITIFNCLCQEMSICICSSNMALLTPVQEALQSFLFPFVWQGCYVPVLPLDMLELLHAPVPLLTGLQCDKLSDVIDDDPTMRPSTLVVVHLDSDTIHFGYECQPLSLPKTMEQKLRQKLVDFGSSLYACEDEIAVLDNAGYLFPNDEHSTPITSFISSQGVLSSIHATCGNISGSVGGGVLSSPGNGGLTAVVSASSGTSKRTARLNPADDADNRSEASSVQSSNVFSSGGSKRTGFGSRILGMQSGSGSGNSSQSKQKSLNVNLHHPAACTVDVGAKGSTAAQFQGIFSRRFALDPSFNVQHDLASAASGPGSNCSPREFDAMEIRAAFLRFFVAAFLDYQDYFSNYANAAAASRDDNDEPNGPRKKNASFVFSSKSVDGIESSSLGTISSSQYAGQSGGKRRPLSETPAVTSTIKKEASFNQAKFIENQEEPFLRHFVQSQMFSNFVSERIEAPDQPEIKFFDEHIIAKRNRSKLALTKESTPFLDDSSENIQQSFMVPGPVTSSLTAGKSYSYTDGFPVPLKEEMKIVVQERGLLQGGGAGDILVKEHGHGPEISRMQGGESLQHMRDRMNLMLGPALTSLPASAMAKNAALNIARRSLSMGVHNHDDEPDSDDDTDDEEQDTFYVAAKRRFDRVEKGIILCQSAFRARPARKRYASRLRASGKIYSWLRSVNLRRTIRYRIRSKKAKKLQHFLKTFLHVLRYKRMKISMQRVQSLYRGYRWKQVFVQQRRSICRMQAWYRGSILRRNQNKQVLSQWMAWRRQLMYLWSAENTPLIYRSSFYRSLDKPSFLHQAMHRQELCRLYESLGFYADRHVRRSESLDAQFRAAQNTSLILRLAALQSSSQQKSAAELARHTNAIVAEALRGTQNQKTVAHVQAQEKLLAKERVHLYQTLKENSSNNEVLFALFNLNALKKRKQKLSDILWVCCNEEYSDRSARVVLSAFNIDVSASSSVSGFEAVTSSTAVDHVALIKQQRVSKHCAETAKACLVLLHSTKGSNK